MGSALVGRVIGEARGHDDFGAGRESLASLGVARHGYGVGVVRRNRLTDAVSDPFGLTNTALIRFVDLDLVANLGSAALERNSVGASANFATGQQFIGSHGQILRGAGDVASPAPPQGGVLAIMGEKFVVRTEFGDQAINHYGDPIGVMGCV